MRKIVLFIVFLVIVFVNGSQAHDNNVIHPFTLTGKAYSLLIDKTIPINGNEEDSPYYELKNYFYDTSIPSGYKTEFPGPLLPEYDYGKIEKMGSLGTIAEDRLINPIGIYGDDVDTYSMFNHFYYAPTSGALVEGSLVYLGMQALNPQLAPPKDIITYTKEKHLWDQSVTYYQAKDYNHAYFEFGRLLHDLQDPSCVPHVFDDLHLTILDSIFKSFKDSFEYWENEYIKYGEVSFFEPKIIRSVLGNNNDYRDYFKALIDETYKLCRLQGKLQKNFSNPENQPDSELKRAFPGLRCVPIDNDGDSFYYDIPELGPWHNIVLVDVSEQYPEYIERYYNYNEDDKLSSYWWKTDNYPDEPGEYYYIERPNVAMPRQYLDAENKLESLSVLNSYDSNAIANLPWHMNSAYNPFIEEWDLTKQSTNNLCALWTGVMKNLDGSDPGYDLLPKTIEYTAGLMKYWYDLVAQLPEMNADNWPSGIVSGNIILQADAWTWKEGAGGREKDIFGINKVVFEYSLDNTNWFLIGESIMPDFLNDNLWKYVWNTKGINDESVWVRAKAINNV